MLGYLWQNLIGVTTQKKKLQERCLQADTYRVDMPEILKQLQRRKARTGDKHYCLVDCTARKKKVESVRTGMVAKTTKCIV
jgi:hypothetical protein